MSALAATPALALLTAALGIAGLAFVGLALARLARLHVLKAGAHGLTGLVLLLLGGLLSALSLNLYTYQRLTHEQAVGEITFHRLSPEHFQADLLRAGSHMLQRFELQGDEWQLDARILKFRGLAQLVGLDARYRLERLSGRYFSVADERRHEHSVYALSRDPGLDLWSLALRHAAWLPWVDARYGSAVYLPMADRARYRIFVTQSGIIARAANPAARSAVTHWN